MVNTEQEYIAKCFNEVWENAESKLVKEIEKNKEQLTDKILSLYEQKVSKIEEVNRKYESELRTLEAIVDPCKFV